MQAFPLCLTFAVHEPRISMNKSVSQNVFVAAKKKRNMTKVKLKGKDIGIEEFGNWDENISLSNQFNEIYYFKMALS